MYVILLSVLAVAMKPGSKVNTPCSLIRFEMSSASGPMVPVMAFIRLVFPVARFLSSYFVLMRYSDGDGFGAFRPAALHGRTSESRERIPSARLHARSQARADLFEIRAAEAQVEGQTRGFRLSPLPHTSCGTYRRDRRYPQFSACRYRTDGSWSKPRPADPGRWSSESRNGCRRYK